MDMAHGNNYNRIPIPSSKWSICANRRDVEVNNAIYKHASEGASFISRKQTNSLIHKMI